MASSQDSGNEFASERSGEEEYGRSGKNGGSVEAEVIALLARDLQRYLTGQVGSLERVVDQWYETLEDQSKQTVDDLGVAYEEAKTYVREHPTQSIAGGFAIGVLIGLISRR